MLTIRCELTGRRLFTELEQPPILVVKSHKPTTQLCRTHTGTSPQFLENLISTIRNVMALHQQFLVNLLLFLFIGRHRAPVRAAPLDKHGDSFWQTDQNFYCPLIHSCPYLSKTTNRRLWRRIYIHTPVCATCNLWHFMSGHHLLFLRFLKMIWSTEHFHALPLADKLGNFIVCTILRICPRWQVETFLWGFHFANIWCRYKIKVIL